MILACSWLIASYIYYKHSVYCPVLIYFVLLYFVSHLFFYLVKVFVSPDYQRKHAFIFIFSNDVFSICNECFREGCAVFVWRQYLNTVFYQMKTFKTRGLTFHYCLLCSGRSFWKLCEAERFCAGEAVLDSVVLLQWETLSGLQWGNGVWGQRKAQDQQGNVPCRFIYFTFE